MSYYYPSPGSHSHHGHHGSQVAYSQAPYASTGYPDNGVVYVPTSGRRHHHSSSGYTTTVAPQVVAPQVITYALQSSHSGHRSRRHHHSSSHHHHSSHRLTLGERIARFFGFGNSSRHYKYRSRNESWGFLGHGRRRRYRDAYTGQEVDRKGRPVIRV
ncbi:hypothetical protein CPB85DRAFT_1329173 [Mucidula mucida]|nr:hypothetical protein CPB85DRAFT_1329173 [Mucidula mucida]